MSKPKVFWILQNKIEGEWMDSGALFKTEKDGHQFARNMKRSNEPGSVPYRIISRRIPRGYGLYKLHPSRTTGVRMELERSRKKQQIQDFIESSGRFYRFQRE